MKRDEDPDEELLVFRLQGQGEAVDDAESEAEGGVYGREGGSSLAGLLL